MNCLNCTHETTPVDDDGVIQWCPRCGSIHDPDGSQIPKFTANATRNLKLILNLYKELRELTPREQYVRELVLCIFIPDRLPPAKEIDDAPSKKE